MIKFAFGSVPKEGVTFTFYRNLRPALLEHGIDICCVSIGKARDELWDENYVDDGCVLLAPCRSVNKRAMNFVQWCEDEQTDKGLLAMGIPLCLNVFWKLPL